MSAMGPLRSDRTASPIEVSVMPARLAMTTRRRSNRSANQPAGSASTIAGNACARPTAPRASASPVR